MLIIGVEYALLSLYENPLITSLGVSVAIHIQQKLLSKVISAQVLTQKRKNQHDVALSLNFKFWRNLVCNRRVPLGTGKIS